MNRQNEIIVKPNKKFIFCAILTFVWMSCIFSFSLQSGEESGAFSGGIVAWLMDYVFLGLNEDVEAIEFFIRKLAHFGEYGLLGILSVLTVRQIKVKCSWIYSFLFCVAVACVDESLQLMVPGRAGMMKDVLIDSAGSICGIGADCIRYTIRAKMGSFRD